MALPSMRNIAASIVTAGQFTRKYDLPASNVTDIAFMSQDTSPGSFADLLKGGPPLSLIRLGSWGFPRSFDEGMFGEVLLGNAQDSLQTLELLRDTVSGSKDGTKLQNFYKLENLTISYESLCRGSMVDFLPSSLRRFTLHAMRFTHDIPKHLLELLGLKEERFPNLERLQLDLWLMVEDIEALSAACRNQGVVWIPYESREVCKGLFCHIDRAFSCQFRKRKCILDKLNQSGARTCLKLEMHAVCLELGIASEGLSHGRDNGHDLFCFKNKILRF